MQRITRHAAAMLLVAAAVASCGGSESREETWDVQASEQECSAGQGPILCLVKRESGTSQWTYAYGGIRGFHYEMGYTYQVKVRITEIDHPVEDQLPEEVELEDVLTKIAVPRSETFELTVTDPASITKVNDTTYRLFERRDLVCTDEGCLAIEAARAAGLSMLLEFDHENSPAGPMHLLRLKCSAPIADFWQTCRQ